MCRARESLGLGKLHVCVTTPGVKVEAKTRGLHEQLEKEKPPSWTDCDVMYSYSSYSSYSPVMVLLIVSS